MAKTEAAEKTPDSREQVAADLKELQKFFEEENAKYAPYAENSSQFLQKNDQWWKQTSKKTARGLENGVAVLKNEYRFNNLNAIATYQAKKEPAAFFKALLEDPLYKNLSRAQQSALLQDASGVLLTSEPPGYQHLIIYASLLSKEPFYRDHQKRGFELGFREGKSIEYLIQMQLVDPSFFEESETQSYLGERLEYFSNCLRNADSFAEDYSSLAVVLPHLDLLAKIPHAIEYFSLRFDERHYYLSLWNLKEKPEELAHLLEQKSNLEKYFGPEKTLAIFRTAMSANLDFTYSHLSLFEPYPDLLTTLFEENLKQNLSPFKASIILMNRSGIKKYLTGEKLQLLTEKALNSLSQGEMRDKAELVRLYDNYSDHPGAKEWLKKGVKALKGWNTVDDTPEENVPLAGLYYENIGIIDREGLTDLWSVRAWKENPEAFLKNYDQWSANPLAREIAKQMTLNFDNPEPGDIDAKATSPTELFVFFLKHPEFAKPEKYLSLARRIAWREPKKIPEVKEKLSSNAFTGPKDFPIWLDRYSQVVEGLKFGLAYYKEEDIRFENFLGDPALAQVHEINPTWVDPQKQKTPAEQGKWMSYTARYLYLNGKELSEETVKEAQDKILQQRLILGKDPIFKDKNIVFVSHGEKCEAAPGTQETHRFGKTATLEAIQRQQGNSDRSLLALRPEKANQTTVREVKERALDALQNTPSPMVFLFDGHGSLDALYLSDGNWSNDKEDPKPNDIIETKKTVKISSEEFAETLLKRAEKNSKNLAQDLLIFSSCFNNTFIRDVTEKLRAKGVVPPRCIGASEYNMVGYSSSPSSLFSGEEDRLMGARFFSKVLQLNKAESTWEDLWEAEDHPGSLDSNPSVYIPAEENLWMQIGSNQAVKNSDQTATS